MNTQAAVKRLQNDPQEAQYVNEQLQALLSRSATDMTFRKKLLDDPRGAMEEFSGKPAPTDVNLVFVENTADATIVLPDPVDASAELSESDLQAVAGGATPVVVACVVLAGAITSSFFTGRNDGQEHN
jgi:hypothetical protein